MPLPDRRQLRPPTGLDDDDLILFADHIEGGRFFNPWGHTPKPAPVDLLKWKFSANPHAAEKRAEAPLVPIRNGLEQFAAIDGLGLLWIGHASFLVEMDGLRVLIDPIFGSAGAVVPRKTAAPFGIDDLPPIDVVLITHGHYDHLDRRTLAHLGARFGEAMTVIVPLGLASAVPRSCSRVIEVDWWTAVDFGGVEAVFVPAQHWHRRSLNDFNRALWGGYILRGRKTFYHAGDSGYFGGFRTLGRIFEEIEVAMLPVGAFEPRWLMHPQHMNPDESLRAFEELGAAHFVGMHWGTYDLTDEPLRHGPERLQALVRQGDRDPTRFHLPMPGACLAL